jgi:predicted DNA-binding transcriptional regulator AlpA
MKPEEQLSEEILDLNGVVQLLGVSKSTVRAIQKSDNPIPCYRIGSGKNKRFRFKKSDVIAYFEKQKQP